MDDDAFVADFSRDRIRELIDEAVATASLLWSQAGRENRTVSFHVEQRRDSPEELPRECRDARHHERREPRACPRLVGQRKFGVFTGGDQDIVLWMLHDRGWLPRTKILNHRELNFALTTARMPSMLHQALETAISCH